MAILYYIDGYNVMYRSAQLRPLLRHHFETARDTLVEKVARFCVASGHRAQIVFDGRGRRAESVPPVPKVPGLEVVYSAGHQTADALIERQVYNAPDRRQLVVVSGDRSLRDLCAGLGAMTMKSDNFLVTVREAIGHARANLHHPQHAHHPLRVEDHLSDEALRYLRHLRKQLED